MTIYFAWDNVLDGITPTIDNGTTEHIDALPAANLNDRILHRPWRHDTTTLSRAEYDLTGVTEDIQVLAMMGCNFSEAAAAGIVKYTTYNPASPGLASPEYVLQPSDVTPYSTWTGMERVFGFLPNATTTGAYVTVETDANTSEFVDVGRAWAGPIWEVAEGGRVQVTYKDTGQLNRSYRQHGFPVQKTRYREVAISVPGRYQTDTLFGTGTTISFLEAAHFLRPGAELICCWLPDESGTAGEKDGYWTQLHTIYGTVKDRLDWISHGGKWMGETYIIQELF